MEIRRADSTELSDAADYIRRGWRWWTSELAQVIPSSWLAKLSPERSTLKVCLNENSSVVSLQVGGREVIAEAISLLNLDQPKLDQFFQNVRSKSPRRPTVVIEVPESFLIRRTLFLPDSVETRLESLLGFEIDRYTPFNRQEALFGFGSLERFPERESISIALFAVARSTVDPYLKCLDGFGLKASQLTPRLESESGTSSTVNMLPKQERATPEKLLSKDVRKNLWVSLGLLLLLLALPAWHLNHRIDVLQNEISGLRDEATSVADRRTLISNYLSSGQAIAERKNHNSMALESLLEVTKRVPDNTWISQLRMDPDNVYLRGESSKASDLIELLDSSGIFKKVRFTSPVVRNPGASKENFEIEMELTGIAQ